MKRWVIGAALFYALIVVAPTAWSQANLGLAMAPAEQFGMSKQRLDRIHDALKQEIEQGKLAGTVVLVARKGKLVYADAVGFQDKEEGKPMALDALFRIYSMTKPLVSVAAMMLVEEGRSSSPIRSQNSCPHSKDSRSAWRGRTPNSPA